MTIFDKTGQQPTITEGSRALDLFTDRGDFLRLFCRRLHADPPEERILFFYGAGGNGKSLLLRYLRERACKRLQPEDWGWVRAISDDERFQRHVEQAADATPVPWAWLDFGAPAQGESRPREPFYALLMLHRQLVSHGPSTGLRTGLRFPLYDFAVLWYLHKTEGLTPERLQSLFPVETLDLVDALTQIITGVGWVGVGKAVLNLFDRHLGERFTLYQHRRRLRPEDVQTIQRMEPDPELRDALPDLFARDLNIAMRLPGAPQRLVLFFDTHEALWGEERELSGYAFFARDEWLRRLLGHLELETGIVPVVAGRDHPRWAEATEWAIPQAFLETHLVGHLSEADARRYLGRAGVEDADLRAHLAAYTEGHPYYLGLCADVVLAAAQRGVSLTPADFQAELETARKDEMLEERLLRYVDVHVEHAVRALSAARAFDWEVYAHLGQALHFQATEPDFWVLTNFSFVRPVGESVEGEASDRYRMHTLLRQLLRDDLTTRRADEALEAFYRAQENETAAAEAVYHAGRLDPERGIKEWCDTFEDALERSRYSLCELLREVRAEMEVPDSFTLGLVSQNEGGYLATLARYREAEESYRAAIVAYDAALARAPDDVGIYNNKGNALLNLGDSQAGLAQHAAAVESYRQAIAAYDEALARAPDYVLAYNNKGSTLASLGELHAKLAQHKAALLSYREAIAACDEALARTPDYISAHNNKGDALWRLGDLQAQLAQHEAALVSYRQAIAACDEALDRAPDHVYAHSNKGAALQSLGELQVWLAQHETALASYQQAIAAYDEALTRAPDYVYAHSGKAVVLTSLGNLQVRLARHEAALQSYQQAIAACDEALTRAPGDVAAYNNKGNTLGDLGELQAELVQHEAALESYQQAIAAYDEALARAPDYVYAHHNRGGALQSLGTLQKELDQKAAALESYRQAVAAHTRATELRPGDPAAWHRLGNALRAVEEYEAAVEAYTRAIELRPNYAWAITRRGWVYRALERYEEALTDFDRAIELKPDYAWAIASRGQVYQALERYEEAVADYTRVTELRPGDHVAWIRLGSALHALGEDEAVLEALTQAIALVPENAYLHRIRAESLILLGRLEEAEEDVAWALEHDPESSYTQGRLGQLRLAQGRFAEAEVAFRQAAAQDEPAWLDGVALALLGQGQDEEALATLERWLDQATRKDRRVALRWLEVMLRHAPQAPAAEACRRWLEA